MGANEQRRFVVTKRDPAEIAAERKGSNRSLGEKLAAQAPGIGGFLLIGIGLFVMVGLRGSSASYWTIRLGAVVIGLGIASLGYWAMSSNNRDYNF
jgi:hypothetical protein